MLVQTVKHSCNSTYISQSLYRSSPFELSKYVNLLKHIKDAKAYKKTN